MILKMGVPTQSPRVACVGAGAWGKNLLRVFSELGALAWICDSDKGRLAEAAKTYRGARCAESIDDALSDPKLTAVVIATPVESHGKLVRRALLAGKDVFVEKPLCLSSKEGRELVALAEDKGRILMVGHLLWYHPAVLKLAELVREGALGRLQYLYASRTNLGRFRREENILWSFAPHDVSVILGLVGESPQSVHAEGGFTLHERRADVTMSWLSFPSGVKAHVFVSWLHPFKEQKLVIIGDKQMAVFDDLEKDAKLRLYPHTIEWKDQVPVAHKAEAVEVPVSGSEPLNAEASHFLQCLRDRRRPRTDGREALRVLETLEACEKALQRRKAAPAGGETFVHETAEIDGSARIGESCSIWNYSRVLKGSELGARCRVGQNVVIGPNVSVGEGVKIQNNVSVYEGVTLEDFVFCGPSVVFTNVINPRSEISRREEFKKTLVRFGATLGANCTILCGVTIGRYAFVGAGAVVTKDVPDHALVVGNPARVAGWRCRCAEPIDFKGSEGSCRACGAGYLKKGDAVRAQKDRVRD